MMRTRSRLLVLSIAAALLMGCATAPGPLPTASAPAPEPWWRQAVFYEIFVRSFYDTNADGIGDLNGVTAKLDYLTGLGVNAIWLMPINPSPSYHGYDVTDYYSINPQYGTMDDFKRLLSEAHQRGMHVIMDLVINHTSSQHPYFLDAAQKGKASKYYDWYIWSDTNPGRHWHALPDDPNRYYFGIFCECMPDLNYRDPAATAETDNITSYWLKDVGVDGFRMDAAKHLIEDGSTIDNTPETHDWLKDFYEFYKAQRNDAYVVGEVGSADASQVRAYGGGQLDHIFNFELARDFVDSANSGASSAVNSGLTFAEQAMPDGDYATFLTNHDQNRTMSALGGDVNKAKLAAFLMLTAPGTPYIYYGEEIGLQGQKPDEDIRRPMQWSAGANAGFTTGQAWRATADDHKSVNVEAEEKDVGSLLGVYKRLVAIRKEYRALQTGLVGVISTGNAGVYAALRVEGEERLLVLANLTGQPISKYALSVSAGEALPRGTYGANPLLGEGEAAEVKVGANGQISEYKPFAEIPPYGMYVMQLSRR